MIGDLRDRHKRRCAQAMKRPRMSKQKSCLSCARSKLKCNQGTPSCERCLDRGIPCEYATNPTYPAHTSSEYQSSDRSGYICSSSGAESLSPYDMTKANEPYGASPSGSASTLSRHDDDQASQWDQAVDNFSAFSIADVGPVTNYASSFPSYPVGNYDFNAAEQLYNDPMFASAPEPLNPNTPFTNDVQPYNPSFRHYGGELYQPQLQEQPNVSLGYNRSGLGYANEGPRLSERSGTSSYRTIRVARSSAYTTAAQDYGYQEQSSSNSTPGSNRPVNYRRR